MYSKPNIRDTITKEDIKRGYKKWRESTSTSPSSRHLGYYKSIIASDGINNSERKKSTETIWDIHTIITNLVIKTSTPLERWRNIY